MLLHCSQSLTFASVVSVFLSYKVCTKTSWDASSIQECYHLPAGTLPRTPILQRTFRLLWHRHRFLSVTLSARLNANYNAVRFSIRLHCHAPSRWEPWRMAVAVGGLAFSFLYRWCVASLAALWRYLCPPITMYHLIWLCIVMTELRSAADAWLCRAPTSLAAAIRLPRAAGPSHKGLVTDRLALWEGQMRLLLLIITNTH